MPQEEKDTHRFLGLPLPESGAAPHPIHSPHTLWCVRHTELRSLRSHAPVIDVHARALTPITRAADRSDRRPISRGFSRADADPRAHAVLPHSNPSLVYAREGGQAFR